VARDRYYESLCERERLFFILCMNCSSSSPHGIGASLCSIPTHPLVRICSKHTQQSRQQAKTPTLLNLPIVHYITTARSLTRSPLLAAKNKPKHARRKMKQNRSRRHSIIYKDCAGILLPSVWANYPPRYENKERAATKDGNFSHSAPRSQLRLRTP